MSPQELQLANEELKALLADRDKQITTLARDLDLVRGLVERLLASRGGRARNPEGQLLLFGNAVITLPEPATAQEPSAIEPAEVDAPNAPDEAAQPSREAKSRSGKPRKIDTTGLPHEDRVHELAEDRRVCPTTGQPLVAVGEKVFEELDYVRARLVVIRHRQVVYGFAPEQAELQKVAPVTADLPPRPLENCAASATLLAWLLVQKYGNHLPLYRQEAIFGRDGLRLPRQTLCDWALRSAEALQPIANCLMTKIRSGPVMQLDDTPVMCQGGKGEQNFQAYLWTFINPEVDGVAFRFTAGRASELLATELGTFTGTLVGDGYSGNAAAAKKVKGDILLAGCWAHTTRKFRDAESEAAGTSRLFRDLIKQLYVVAQEADAANHDPPARTALRREKARPILAKLFAHARRLRHQFSDAGKMAAAIAYLLNQRKPLRRFLDDIRVPLDNNACERAIRPIAIGRRNWLFAGSLRGGRAAAVIYTLIESCRRADLDPVAYLADVLVRVATHPASRIAELLPAKHTAQTAALPPQTA